MKQNRKLTNDKNYRMIKLELTKIGNSNSNLIL